MKYNQYIEENTNSLKGKTVVITGATEGLGKSTSYYLAHLEANIILVGRDINKLNILKNELININKNIKIFIYSCDFIDIESIKNLLIFLKDFKIDILINNAGSYALKNQKTSLNINNIFQINFIVPYYITKQLLPNISKQNGKVIIVSSITYNLHQINKDDIEFINHSSISRYGNSKRYELFAFRELFKYYKNVKLTIVHPGISATNITSNYNKFNRAIVKYPMKILFTSPDKAALTTIKGIFTDIDNNHWIGPRILNIWGYPKINKIKINEDTSFIYNIAEDIYNNI